MREKISLLIVYVFVLVGVFTLILGVATKDTIICIVGFSLIIVAILLKLELKLNLAFWKSE